MRRAWHGPLITSLIGSRSEYPSEPGHTYQPQRIELKAQFILAEPTGYPGARALPCAPDLFAGALRPE